MRYAIVIEKTATGFSAFVPDLPGCIATGRNAGALSMATVTETLVRPFRVGASAVAIAEQFLQHFGQMQLMDITYEIAREAARLRADSQLRTPDALILATALVSGASVVVTNDARWRNAAPKIVPELSICYLQDHLPL